MRVIQRYNRKICFTEFFDLYRLEIKLCLIIKTLGVTGACPRSAFRQPPPTYRSFSLQSFNHSGICTIARSIAAVCVKIRIVDFDVHDSTTLPISGFNVAMCGADEVARNGGAGSKERKALGVNCTEGCRVTYGATGLCCWACTATMSDPSVPCSVGCSE